MIDNDTAPLVRSKQNTPGSLWGKVVWTRACPMKASDPASTSASLRSEALPMSLLARGALITEMSLSVASAQRSLAPIESTRT